MYEVKIKYFDGEELIVTCYKENLTELFDTVFIKDEIYLMSGSKKGFWVDRKNVRFIDISDLTIREEDHIKQKEKENV